MRPQSILVVIALLACGCDNSSSTTSTDSQPTQPASQPWSSRPKAVEDYLSSTRAAATSAPATTQTARRAIDSLTRPDETVNAMFAMLRGGNFAGVREMMYEPLTSSEVADVFARSVEGFKRGASVSVIDHSEKGSAAIVIVRSAGKVRSDNDTSYLLLLRRFDRWKVLLDEPNSKRLAPEEKQDLISVMRWGTDRLAELRGAQTRPATTTSTQASPTAH